MDMGLGNIATVKFEYIYIVAMAGTFQTGTTVTFQAMSIGEALRFNRRMWIGSPKNLDQSTVYGKICNLYGKNRYFKLQLLASHHLSFY